MAGPLEGIRLIEIAGIGPGPMAAMMLGDLGADIIRVDRLRPTGNERLNDPRYLVHQRSRRSIAIDLRRPEGAELVLRLAERADGLMEPFRPGVAERLGIGPDRCLARNPRLVYGRITGWGQEGPLAKAAGHDINYIALAGALGAIGTPERPVPPLNLIGDYGGGGMLLAFGMLAGLLEASRSGSGQVIDAAMVDGTALLMGMAYGMHAAGTWSDRRGENALDGGAPYYNVFETADRQHVCIGSIEPQFYALLLQKLELSAAEMPAQNDRALWPAMHERFAALFRRRTRAEWCALMEGTDVCFAPVLSMTEAQAHPHNRARGAFIDIGGAPQPAPAPRFSRTPPAARVAPDRGEHTEQVLREAGLGDAEREALRAAGVVL